MAVTNADYLGRFLEDVDRVMSGRPGSISEDRWLINNYDSGKADLLKGYLSCDDERIRAEVVTLFGEVRERAVKDKIDDMGRREGEKVRMACIGYQSVLSDDDELIPRLFEIMDHSEGSEFIKAASRMGSIATEDDIPHLRRIYGQVGGEMRSAVKVALDRTISRYPGLVPKRDLILTSPVYPNEEEFERFLDSSFEYLDVRYRSNVFPQEKIKQATYSNVVRALGKMRIRLYNEADNLDVYGADKTDRARELAALVSWAGEDLAKKKVVAPDNAPSRVCPSCGGLLVCYKGMWICPDCGGNL